MAATMDMSSSDGDMRMAHVLTASWRLPSNKSIEENEQYLNEQLGRVEALDSWVNGVPALFEGDASLSLGLHDVVRLVLARQSPNEGPVVQTENNVRAEQTVRDALDVVSYLLLARQQDQARQRQLSEALRRAESDTQRQATTIERLRQELEAQKQTLAYRENVFQAEKKVLIGERKTLQLDKKNLEVMCAKLQGVETTYKAHLRKKETEYERLKKSLNTMTSRSARDQPGLFGAKVVNASVSDRKHPITKLNHAHEARLTQQILANYEQKNAELLFENDALMKSYESLQKEVEQLSARYKKTVQHFLTQKPHERAQSLDWESARCTLLDDFEPEECTIPCCANLPQQISRAMEELQISMHRLESTLQEQQEPVREAQAEEIIRVLRAKLEEANGIIRDQDQMLQAAIMYDVTPPERVLRDYSMVEDERDAFEFDKKELLRARENLSRDRQNLYDQSVKFDQERLAFEIEKQRLMFGSSKTSNSSLTRNNETTPHKKRASDDELMKTPHRRPKMLADSLSASLSFTSPLALCVAPTPATSALLKRIGVQARDGEMKCSSADEGTTGYLSPISKR